jgi:hypothetical protein
LLASPNFGICDTTQDLIRNDKDMIYHLLDQY